MVKEAFFAVPGDLAVGRIEGVDRVVLGGGVDAVADRQWLGIDLAVEGRGPDATQAAQPARGAVDRGPREVGVIRGPVGGAALLLGDDRAVSARDSRR